MADEVWIDVLPSMRDFGANLAKQVVGAAKSAGADAGKAYSKAFDSGAGDVGADAVKAMETAQKQAAGLVQRLAGEVSTARQAQKKSAADLLTAEQKLADAANKYGEDSTQAQAAALKLEAAREKATNATEKFERAESALKEGQAALKVSTEQLEQVQNKANEEVKEAPGLWGKLKSSMADASDQAGDTSLTMAKVKDAAAAMAKAVVGAATAAVALGAGVFGMGAVLDDVQDTIRVGTGATGEVLESLVDSAQTVGSLVPANFEAIGNTVADVNTRLGLTGTTLETFAAQTLEAGRMLGEELDLNTVTGLLNNFQIEGEGAVDAMDLLFQISQATGIGMNNLADSISTAAPAVQDLGFSFEDTAFMVGLFDKAGLNTDQVMTSMSRGLVNLAKQGEEPAAAFQRVVGEIGSFIDAGNTASALDLASQVFGTRGATQFVAAIESGALAMDQLAMSSMLSGDTILGVSQETMDFSEQWQLFKNGVLVDLEPIASRLFTTLSEGMAWLKSTGVPAIKDVVSILFEGDYTGGLYESFGLAEDSGFVDFLFDIREAVLDFGTYLTGTVVPGLQSMASWMADNQEWLLGLVSVLGGAVLAYQAWTTAVTIGQTATKAAAAAQAAFNAVALANPIMLVVIAVAALVAGLVYFFTQTEVGQKAWAVFTDAVATGWAWLVDKVTYAWETYLKPTWDAIVVAATWLWQNVLHPYFTAMGVVWGAVIDGIVWYWNNYLSPTFNAIATLATWLWDNVLHPYWTTMSSVWGQVIEGMVWVWNNYLSPMFNAIGGVVMWLWDKVASPYFERVKAAWALMIEGMVWVWDNALKPAFETIGKFITETLPRAFETGRDAIGRVWDGIRDLARRPINFVIETVYNNGLRKAVNRVVEFIGGTPLPAMDPIPAFASGGQYSGGWALVGEEGPELINFNTGGYVYNAAQTQQMTGWTPGGNVVTNFVTAIQDTATGGFGALVSLVLNPVRDAVRNTLPGVGITQIARNAALTAIDNAVSWASNEDTTTVNHTLYDNGGVLQPGVTSVLNATGRPEYVFTPEQLSAIEDASRTEMALSEETIDRLAERIAEELGLVGDTVREVKRAIEMARAVERMG